MTRKNTGMKPIGVAFHSKSARWVQQASDDVYKGLDPGLDKYKLAAALKTGKEVLGLSKNELLLLLYLIDCARPQDWKQGTKPIVWPSNYALAEELELEVRQVQRYLASLEEAHRLILRSRRGGRRFGRRNKDGRIINAQGIDLSPAAVRAPEILAAAEEARQIKSHKIRLRTELGEGRGRVRAMTAQAIEEGWVGADWKEMQAVSDRFGRRAARRSLSLLGLEALVDEFRSFFVDLQAVHDAASGFAFCHPEAAASTDEKTPQHVVGDVHKTSTNLLSLRETNTVASQQNQVTPRSRSDVTYPSEDTPLLSSKVARDLIVSELRKSKLEAYALRRISPVMDMLLASEPDGWESVLRVGPTLRKKLGISSTAWRDAEEVMSPFGAVFAACIIDGKRGELWSPGGYFFGMVKKARKGQCRLAPAIFGLLEERQETGPSEF